jgi:LEA14-like dessication related protein
MRHVRFLPLLCSLAALAGCALFVSRLTPPRLSIVSVHVRSADFWQQRLRVRIRVRNPNDLGLGVKTVSYVLDIDGQRIAAGICAQGFTVPAHGTAEFDTQVTANMAGAVLTVLAQGRNRPLHYRLRGRVQLAEGWLRSLPFDERGSFTLR